MPTLPECHKYKPEKGESGLPCHRAAALQCAGIQGEVLSLNTNPHQAPQEGRALKALGWDSRSGDPSLWLSTEVSQGGTWLDFAAEPHLYLSHGVMTLSCRWLFTCCLFHLFSFPHLRIGTETICYSPVCPQCLAYSRHPVVCHQDVVSLSATDLLRDLRF